MTLLAQEFWWNICQNDTFFLQFVRQPNCGEYNMILKSLILKKKLNSVFILHSYRINQLYHQSYYFIILNSSLLVLGSTNIFFKSYFMARGKKSNFKYIHISLGGCTILNFFLPFGSALKTLYSKKFQKTLILFFEANSVLSCQNGLFSAFQLCIVKNLEAWFSNSIRNPNIWYGGCSMP